MLDTTLKVQTQQYLELLEGPVQLAMHIDESEHGKELEAFVKEICSWSDKLSYTYDEMIPYVPAFRLDPAGNKGRVTFAGVPVGHEYNSFILALIQTSGRTPNLPENTIQVVRQVSQTIQLTTYVSLTCHNCPDVVQSLNSLAILNPNISHTMVNGAWFKEEVEAQSIMAVPAVYKDGEFFLSGKQTLTELLAALDIQEDEQVMTDTLYDVLVVGGGPAGVSAALYTARKGVKTALVVKEFGGQINETLAIENIVGIPTVEGPALSTQFEQQIRSLDIDIIEGHFVQDIEQAEADEKVIILDNKRQIKAKTIIVATGSHWRHLNVPGEQEFKNKGVAYCPHCDAPLFADKRVAVVGGGNSGVEAALDLAGIAKEVTLLQYNHELTADDILKQRVEQMSNVNVLTDAQTLSIDGETHVTGLTYRDLEHKKEVSLELDGVFIQIGLMPNTAWVKDRLDLNERGEIKVDKTGATSVPGIFAAGDCTDSAYKQIVISMGSGATAAISAFNYLMTK